MILTGRAGLVALLCALPVVLSHWPATTFAVLVVLLAALVVLDVALAASPRALRIGRDGETSVR